LCPNWIGFYIADSGKGNLDAKLALQIFEAQMAE
jgi:hypothetical protein